MESAPRPQQPDIQPDQPTEPIEQAEQHNLSDAELKKIKKKMGETAWTMVATTHSEESRESAALEATNEALKDFSKEHPFWTRFPVIGGVVKAGMAWRSLKKARAGISETGTLEGAFKALELDPSRSRVIENAESTNERAWQALQSAGYSEENRDVSYKSRLDEETVERMDDETEAKVKAALKEYYDGLKGLGSKKAEEERKQLEAALDEAVQSAFKDKDGNLDTSINLEAQKEAVRKLARARSLSEESIHTYIDEHMTLYRASMQENIHTQQKVNGVLSAVAAGGLVAGIFAGIGLSGGGSMALRAAGVGGITGGIIGAIHGVENANIDLSEAEIKAATTFDEGPKEPEMPSNLHEDGAVDAYAQEIQDAADEAQAAQDAAANKAAANTPNGAKAKQKAGILAAIANFHDRFTKKDEIMAQIEEKRDRKTAKELIEAIESIAADDPDRKAKLQQIYSEIMARGQFSREKHIDLIKYQEGQEGGDKLALEQKLAEIGEGLFIQPEDERRAIDKAKASLQLEENYAEAEKLRNSYIRRRALVDGIVGAAAGTIIGGVVGAVAGAIGDNIAEATPDVVARASADGIIGGAGGASVEETLNGLSEANPVELSPDPDGGYSVIIEGKELIGEGNNPGITFGEDGALTAESKEMLESAGIDVEEKVVSHTVEGAHTNVSLAEYFSAENQEANNLVEVTSRAWHSDSYGNPQAIIGNSYMDGSGNIVIPVAATQGSDLDLNGMKMFITPGDGNESLGITVDVNSDGNVVIPADSPAASLFNADGFQGGYAELVREGANGHMDVYSTIGDGQPDVSSVSVDSPNATYNTYEYELTVDDKTYEIVSPDDSAAVARMEAATGLESLKSTGDPVGYETVAGVTGLHTVDGEAVEVEHFKHYGGYNDAYDSYFGEKDGVYNSGESVVRHMLGDDANGLSSQEADRIFFEKVNSGEIAEGDIVEELLKTKGNSPESIVTTRALLGDFHMDLDGDGVAELIDTQDELNMAADIISRDPEAYDAFVNDTYELFYSKIEGGSIRIVDYTQEQYQYTTWGELGEDNNVLQRLGLIGHSQTDGIGIVFTDKDGNSIYDENIARSLWRLPDGYDISYIGDRLNCIQNTIAGVFPPGETPPGDTPPIAPPPEKVVDEKQTGEKQTDEKQLNEKQVDEKQTNEKQTNEKQTGEKQTDEKQVDEKQTDEKQTDEKQTDELTGKGPDAHAGPGAQPMEETELRPGTNYVEASPDNHVDPDVKPGSEVNDADSTVYANDTVTDENGEPLTDDAGNIYITNPADNNVSADEIAQNIADGTQTTYTEDTTDWVADAPSDVPSTTNSAEPMADTTAPNSTGATSGSTTSSASASTDTTDYDQDELASIYSNIRGGQQ